MQIRLHRGPLADSMSSVEIIEPRRQAIFDWVQRNYGIQTKIGSISCTPYGYDNRIDWDTHIISVDGFGVIGFTDQSITED